MASTDEKAAHGNFEAFGKDFSQEDLADVFSTCVFCLNHAIDEAPTTMKALQLGVVRLRLTRWGEAVEIYEKPTLGHHDLPLEELLDIRRALIAFVALFDTGSSKVTVKAINPDDIDEETQLLQKSLGAIASKRLRAGKSLLKPDDLERGRWFDLQLEHASYLIRRLESCFRSKDLRDLAASERLQIKNERAIDHLNAIAQDLDPWIAVGPINHEAIKDIYGIDVVTGSSCRLESSTNSQLSSYSLQNTASSQVLLGESSGIVKKSTSIEEQDSYLRAE